MGIVSFFTNKKVLSFLGGIATATIGMKILKSNPVHRATVRVVAGGMKLRDDAMSCMETIKEDAQDIYEEAKQSAREDAPEEPEGDE